MVGFISIDEIVQLMVRLSISIRTCDIKIDVWRIWWSKLTKAQVHKINEIQRGMRPHTVFQDLEDQIFPQRIETDKIREG